MTKPSPFGPGRPRKITLARALVVAATVGCSASTPCFAALYHYVDWTAADPAAGTASGTITLPDDSTVTVTFQAINPDETPGTLLPSQTSGGTNYWSPSTPYVSAEVENAPTGTDILRLAGGQNQVYRVTLSEPIKDPIMAILSLGQPAVPTTYDFDAPFAIVSQGPGYWGGSAMALQQLPGDVLEGREGHGTIQFIGTFATFSWTVPTPENWHGFTFGIRTTERLEPPDAGIDAAPSPADAAAPDADPLPDAPVSSGSDASAQDAFGSGSGAGPDAGRPRVEDEGCSCRVGRASGAVGAGPLAALLLLSLGLFRRRWAGRRP